MSVGGHSQQKDSMKSGDRPSFILKLIPKQVFYNFYKYLIKILRIVKNSYEYLLFAHVIVILATDS